MGGLSKATHNLVVQKDLHNTAASHTSSGYDLWAFWNDNKEKLRAWYEVPGSTERSLDPTLFRVHRTGVLDPSRLHGRAAGQVLQQPHCGCNTSQVQQIIRVSELKWQKTCFLFLIVVEGIWRAY